ncbi:MAG: hypothetical protein Q9222_002588 [Ikaeria aurantiellina]
MAPKKPPTHNKMDLDLPPPTSRSVLSTTTHPSHISKTRPKPLPLPRGKSLRAQRLRKLKGAERADEVRGRTEKKVQKSVGRGRRKGERKAVWEELNAKIKGSVGEAKAIPREGEEKTTKDTMKGGVEGEWADEDGKMVDVDDIAAGDGEVVEEGRDDRDMDGQVDDGIL